MRRPLLALPIFALVLALQAADARAAQRAQRLAAFDSCSQLVDWASAGARRTGGLRGVPVRALPAPAPGLAQGGG
ncbi:MAG: hypothetical protein LT070_02760, partial [Solirubrobacteraceae bacterium]|nr:hypothetical protein [Solirubrobacteraceae bacterium]